MQQIGTCVVFKTHGCYPTAECLRCGWKTSAIYDDDLARQVAEHSRLHEPSGTTVSMGKMTITYSETMEA